MRRYDLSPIAPPAGRAHIRYGMRGHHEHAGVGASGSHLSSSRKTTVIVIDDDIFVRRALKTELEILGFKVVVRQSAEDLLAKELPDHDSCVLSDVYLPGMSGIELCRHLAAAGTSLPTILMTGRDDEHTRRLMREAKPIACLFKPFDEATLLRAVRKATQVPPKRRS
jgi:FixJ family two-component response regulator